MSDRHTIIVRVQDGNVREVLFCDCCPAVTLEVRTYTDSPRAAALALPTWSMKDGTSRTSEFKRDERGVYESAYYEPDDEEE